MSNLNFLRRTLNLIISLSDHWWGQLFFIILPVFVILFPVLLGGNIFFSGDIIAFEYPNFVWYQRIITSAGSIFWNNQILSGFPVFASAPGGYLSPIIFLFFRFFDIFTAYHWLIFLNLILAGFFTCCLLKELSLSGIPSIIGGLVYIFSQWTIADQLTVTNSYPILPLLFLLLVLIYKRNIWWPIILGILAIGLLWISAHYNWSVIILFGAAIFTLFLCWQERKNLKQIIRLLFSYFLMVLGGTILGIFQLIPALTYLQLSARSSGLSYQEGVIGVAKLADLLTFISPHFIFPLISGDGEFYIGILPLFLLIFVIILRNPFSRFFSFLFIFSLVLAIQYSPLYWVLQKLPAFQYLRGPSRWLFLGFFCAAINVGFGAQHFLDSGFERWKKFLVKIFQYLLIIFTSFSVLINLIFIIYGKRILTFLKLYFDKNIYPKTSGLPLEHYHQVIDNLFFDLKKIFDFSNTQFLITWLLIVFSFLLIFIFYKQKENLRYFLPLVLIVGTLNFILVFYNHFKFLSSKVFEYQPNIVRFISNNSENNDRILSFLPGFTEFQKITVPHQPEPKELFIFQSEILAPSLNLFYNIKSIDGYDNLMPKRYSEIIALIGSDRAVIGDKLSEQEIPLEDKIKLFQDRYNLLDMLGVRYVISAYNLENKNLIKIFETKATQYQIPLYLYENKDFLPLVYLAKEVKYLSGGAENNLGIVTDNQNNFNQTTFIECFNCQDITRGGGEIKIEEYKNGYLELKVQTISDSWLIFNESNLPGWQATIDGQRTKIYPANYLFQAILVPAGKHQIIFNFNYFNILATFLPEKNP